MITMKKGFTLAEVLITLAIVGVVAAVSLPTLNTNVQKQGLSAQIAKFYNQFGKAIEMYKADNELDKIPNSFDKEAFVKKYFKVTQKCNDDGDNQCIPERYRTINNDIEDFAAAEAFVSDNTYMLADGAVMSINQIEGWPIEVVFDVNGLKGPNIVGYDMQIFSVFYDGSIDENGATPQARMGDSAALKNHIESRFENCKQGNYGGCFGHLLRNGFRFDY